MNCSAAFRLSSAVLVTMSSRAFSTFWIGGTTKVPMTARTIRKIARTTKKVPLGMRKLFCFPPSSAASAATAVTAEATLCNSPMPISWRRESRRRTTP
ncbi:Uncharacterised protein [Mycobacteroides abscessus subsp. abscessus]|nr:Uncharacterised protein [Mycobacteroides abscessus subsp. abscessus]